MASVERVLNVRRPVNEVVDYLADFGNAEYWDPGTISCERLDGSGPVEVGARWRNVSQFIGRRVELEYRLTHRDDRRLTFEGGNAQSTSVDDLRFAEHDSGSTRITYHATISLKGALKLAEPVLLAALQKIANDTVAQMKRVLEDSDG